MTTMELQIGSLHWYRDQAGTIHICQLSKSTKILLDSIMYPAIIDISPARSKNDEASGDSKVVCYLPGSSIQMIRCRSTMESGSWLKKLIEINSSLVY